ncbi:rhodanese-like domain-containing protein [Actinocorallia aurantiaca]|uniref:Rhodanese domain-containing protein n=1 Tax=Actinocorallia aurantiaca TaxID=46204 RepID=A0ABP6GTY0_9ACTN
MTAQDQTPAQDGLLTPEQAAAKLAEGALFVDVRRPEARVENGALPGAVPVEKIDVTPRFSRDSSALLPEAADLDREIVVFCSSERGSGPVVERLLEFGYTRVGHIDGGFSAWKEQGFDTYPNDAEA